MHTASNGVLLSKFGHESDPAQMLLRDAAGNLKREVVAHAFAAFSGTTSYSYDNKDQLLNESSTRNSGLNNAFGYDLMGNPTSWKGQARTFNLNNQETTGGPYQFAYDGNGNPTIYKGSSFVFDESDKVTRITTSVTVLMQAGYRSDGLRAWKSTSNGTTYFLYDGYQLVCEFDANGSLKNTNIWGANGLLSRRDEGSSSTRFYLWDDRGNIAQSLNADGTVATNFNVSAWGDVVRDVPTSGAYFGLGGQFGNYFDVETGLLLCGQRYYDSGAGRWIGRDPIGYAGGLNVYGYVGNNPVNFVDPYGLFQLSKDFAKKYPKAAKRINTSKTRLTKSKYDAYRKYGQANKKAVNNAFTSGKGPLLQPAKLSGAFGEFTPNVKSNTIRLSDKLLKDYEAGRASNRLLDATVEHEATHYSDDQDGKDCSGEEGELYEKKVYGKVIFK